MASILVTGASGRLGSSLIEALRPTFGNDIAALIQAGSQEINGVTNYSADIEKKESMEKAFNNVDIVVHLAAIVSQYKFGKEKIFRVNVGGTKNVLEMCKEHSVKKIVFASSVDVYGANRKDLLSESSMLKPADAYGKSKAEAEKLIIDSGIDYVIFRMAVIYGPKFEGSFFKVFDSVKRGNAYIIGDGSNLLSLIHIRDVVSAYMLAIQKNAHGIYNLSDGMSYTQLYLYNLAAKLLGVEMTPKHVGKFAAMLLARLKGFDTDELRFITSNRRIDTTKIRKELGFAPLVSINEGGSELVGMFLSSSSQKVQQ